MNQAQVHDKLGFAAYPAQLIEPGRLLESLATQP